jgi:hypothetical protein
MRHGRTMCLSEYGGKGPHREFGKLSDSISACKDNDLQILIWAGISVHAHWLCGSTEL